jgi:NADPH:quinone reductase-like Zn-dependent oxidoreductase
MDKESVMKLARRPMDEDAGAVGLADATRASTMLAIAQRRYGQPDVLEYTAVDKPVVGDDDVLVRVHAAAVHPGDYFLMTGVPYMVRIAFGLRRPRNAIPGRDVAGRIEAVGANVSGLEVGDEVFGWSTAGTLAEYARAPGGNFVVKPAGLTMEQAAAIPTSAFTALQAMRDVAKVQPGQTVLIVGASGGVGTFAVQIANAFGAEVTAVCSTRSVDLVRSLGADHVIDYTRTDFTQTGQRYDVILDSVEAQSLSATRRALEPHGTLIPNNGGGGRWFGPLGRILRARLLSLFTRQVLRPFLSRENRDDLVALAELVEAGKVTSAIDRTYPLSQGAEALRYVGEGHTQGKVVVIV